MSSGGAATHEDRLNKAAVVIRRLKEKIALLEEDEQRGSEPIAIVGMGCRFPGGADNPDAFWSLLDAGRDAVQSLDARWALVGSRPSEGTPAWAGLLTEPVDAFDPEFFGISPREARSMDPQHRLLLEVTWEALENAAILPAALEGSRTGVFVGACSTDYQHIIMRQPPEAQDLYSTTGNMLSVGAGRISYTFGFQGPCLMIDTACSSSLVAAHLACRSLRTRESDLALAGGVNLLLSPIPMEAGARMQALSPDGRCRTFDAAANGFVRGEGCGLIVLKRVSDARRDGDRIWGLIRGSAVNQDGRSTGLTAPNVLAQEALLREALKNARVTHESIGYVETHGTGTSIGDPIEVEALRAVIGPLRSDGGRCALGALKTNIGHLEGAAGVAGLMKAVLALEHEKIPRNINFRALNPRIRLDGSSLVAATEATSWPRTARPRFAGVSSFGLSGTNAHVVLEEAPLAEGGARAPHRSSELLVLSARSVSALNAQAARLSAHLDAHPELLLGDVAFSLATTRTAMEHRVAIPTSSREQLREALESVAIGETPTGAVRGRASVAGGGKVVFVFPGQGSQWLGMGKRLLAEEPVFHATIVACDRAIQAEAGFSTLAELAADEATSQLNRIDVVQPVLFAIEVALSALWQSWGVQPDLVVGHSMGEVAAAHVAGALSLEDAVAIICRRSRLLRRISGEGEMALVELTAAEAQAALSGYEDRLSVAVSNSPRSTVLSGEPSALAEVLTSLEARGVFVRRVKVDVASHSPQVDPLRDDLLAALSELRPSATVVPMCSTVTGAMASGTNMSAEYWADNVRQPVRFAQAVQSLIEEGASVFIEMSPHPILLPSVEEILGLLEREGIAVGSLRRNQDERQVLLESFGALWAHGHPVAWGGLFPAGGRRIALPTYPWQDRERHWLDVPEDVVRRGANVHPLLGHKTRSSLSEGVTYWTNDLSLKTNRYLEEHRVGGQVVFPAAAHVEMALKAGAEELGGTVELRGFEVNEALLLAEDERRVVQLALSREGAQSARFQIASAIGTNEIDGKWTLHCRGKIERIKSDGQPEGTQLEALRQRTQSESWEAFEGDAFYARLLTAGLEYGETFRGVQRGWRRAGEAFAELACVGDVAQADRAYRIHPGLLDAALQVIAAAMGDQETGMFLPSGIEAIRVTRPGEGWSQKGKLWTYARCAQAGNEITSDLWVRAESGELLVEVTGFKAKRVQGTGGEADDVDRWLHEVHWEEIDENQAPLERVRTKRNWVVFVDSAGAMQGVVEGLTAQGCRVLQVSSGDAFSRDVGHERAFLDPQDHSQYARLLDELPAEFCAEGWGILHGWSLDDTLDGANDIVQSRLGWRSLLLLVQALAGGLPSSKPRVVVLTRGARSVVAGDRVDGLLQTPIVGLCKTVTQEHPELACHCIDAGGTAGRAIDPDDVQALLAELGANSREQETALRGGRRFVSRLVRSAPPVNEAGADEPSYGPIHSDGIYVITGGFGGLGLALARWIARRGARHVALLGRSAPGKLALAVIDELRTAGVEVLSVRADVSHLEELRGALAELTSGGRPIRGVFHLAGFLDNAVLSALSVERFARVLEPKMQGSWNLHELTSEQPLDMFVLFSSVASVFGAPGQANHAAANSFLDGFAAYRAARGAPASSINWGAWAELGEAAEGTAAAYVASRGLRAMTPEYALRAFARASSLESVQVAIVAFDRDGPADLGLLDRPLFSRLAPELVSKLSRKASSEGGMTRKQVLDAAPGDRHRLVTNFLRDLVATQAGFARSKLEVHRPLTSLGLDSLMTLKIKNRIESSLGASVPTTLFLQGITTAQLASRVISMLGADDTPTALDAPLEPSGAAARAAQRRATQAKRSGSR
jgi:myxalamid-type polyketide synthase MxaE and MxaD